MSLSLRLQRGLSLVELMVSITLGLFLTLAVIQVFTSSRGAFRSQDSMSVLQENGRFALAFLTEDIRMAGYMGCPRITTLPTASMHNNLAATPKAKFDFTAASTLSGTNNVGASNTWGAAEGTDVIRVLRAKNNSARLNGTASGTTITLASATGNPSINAGDVIMISDCIDSDIVSVTQVSSDKLTLTINASLSKSYGADADVFPLILSEYFVKDTGRDTAVNSRNINGLFVRQYTKTADATATPQEYELVEGVQDMQLEYGEDTNSDRAVDTYRYKGSDTTAPTWANVLSVRVNLLMQGTEDNVATGDQAQSIKFFGADVAADGRLRQVFSSTSAIRNRLP